MKRIILARHAKSSWSYTELTDFERPLNKRGRKDAPFMGHLLADKDINIDLIVSSPALRAYYTARIIAECIDYPAEKIHSSELLYLAGIRNYVTLISSTDPSVNSLMLFSHNPGLTDFNNFISDKQIDNIPTCGILTIELNISKWAALKKGSGRLIDFDYPKKHTS